MRRTIRNTNEWKLMDKSKHAAEIKPGVTKLPDAVTLTLISGLSTDWHWGGREGGWISEWMQVQLPNKVRRGQRKWTWYRGIWCQHLGTWHKKPAPNQRIIWACGKYDTGTWVRAAKPTNTNISSQLWSNKLISKWQLWPLWQRLWCGKLSKWWNRK